VKQIDKWTRKADHWANTARRLYQSAIEIRKEARKKKTDVSRQRLLNSAIGIEEEADRKVDYAIRLRRGKLKQLQNKLAEFDTETLPGMMDDKSVQSL